MGDLTRINRDQLNSALTQPSPSSRRSLSKEEYATLSVLMAQMTQRYSSQALEQSMQGYLADFEQLALKYSLRKVQKALEVLRIKPGQKFFPRPDEVAEEIEAQMGHSVQSAQQRDGEKWLADYKAHMRYVRTSPEEIAWRKERFGYDPFCEKPPEKVG